MASTSPAQSPATQMNEHVARLERIMRDQLQGQQLLLECIHRKREAVRTADLDSIASICQREHTIVQRLAEMEKARLELIGKLTEALDSQAKAPLTVSRIADAIDEPILAADFEVDLAADGNGLRFTDNTLPPGGTFSIEALNGSFAASDLGIVGSTTSATFVGEDRATVAVDSVFSHLIALRDALLGDDQLGITIATERLERDINRLAEARATVGVRSRRVANAVIREEDLRIQDMALRSEVQDLDFTEAALRFSTLQQQLQAGLVTASQVTSMSLLDFLR
ncbi:MAG: flagellin [Phycisphaerales bacterium]